MEMINGAGRVSRNPVKSTNRKQGAGQKFASRFCFSGCDTVYDEAEKDKGYNTEEPPRSLIIESNSHRVCSIVYTKSEYESSRNPEMSPIHFTLL